MGNIEMNEAHIQRILIRNRYQRHMTVPNFTPRGWFESDVFELTESGRFREYEVKLTRADYFADSQKLQKKFNYSTNVETVDVKHDLLKARSLRGPTQFWFVTPANLIAVKEVPEWAGLIAITETKHEVELKPAPRLHREKLDQDAKAHAQGICYWRFMKLYLRT